MDVIQTIASRRSIRKFKVHPVPDDLIQQILRAAMQAPSAHNMQPWHFLLINDHEQLSTIAQFHPYAEMLTATPLAMAVCGDRRLESDDGYLALDCAAATQNILLCATALGLGAVWLGIYPRTERMSELKKIIGLPKHILPISLVAIGYPDELKKPVDRYQPDRVYLNRFGRIYVK